MDCSQTQNGWFEFTTIYSIGGEDGEPSVAQESCTGDVGGDSPISIQSMTNTLTSDAESTVKQIEHSITLFIYIYFMIYIFTTKLEQK